MVEIMIMQRMSVAMEYGVILEWLKEEGEHIEKGEPVVEIFGEKNEFELESPYEGILLKQLCEVDDEIPISEPIAIIGEKDEEVPDITPKKLGEMEEDQTPAAKDKRTAVEVVKEAESTGQTEISRLRGGRVKASPRARKKAEELGVNIKMVGGTGPGGRIVEDDIIEASKVQVDSREVKELEPMSPLRRTIARRMTESSERPHITMITEIDMTEVVKLRKEINTKTEKTHALRISFNDIVVKAVADTLEKFPHFNATLEGNNIKMYDDINIGIAMATDEGLIVPTVFSANEKSITEIAQESQGLKERAQEGELTSEELSGSTFTVSNLGPFQVDLFIPLINPPEAAILALGQIKEKPVAVDGMIGIRHMMMASCAVDHRILDGAPAGKFLQALKESLENPYFMKI
ncbi:MAG: 2-oxo acid dehydrogenase subunit E2 [Candidatus Thorarchaeota archaeon]|nr:2-oxo acid dehydrogenase subunit E2 [Candidatus Thorarchaeota archaeon]